MNWQDVEVSDSGLMKILSQHFYGGSEEYHEKPGSIAIVLV
jgi:hypothetical protein